MSIKQRVPFSNIKELLNKPNQTEVLQNRKNKEAIIHNLEKLERLIKKRDKLVSKAKKTGFLEEGFQTVADAISELRNIIRNLRN